MRLKDERTDELIFELRKRGYVTLAEGENIRLRVELDVLRGQIKSLESELAEVDEALAAAEGELEAVG